MYHYNKMKQSQKGSALTIAIMAFLAVGVLALAVLSAWGYSERTKYKDQADQIVAKAVQENTASVQAKDAAAFAEEAKKPLKPYTGPEAYGTVHFEYPKTWSMYNNGNKASTSPVDLYGAVDVVPSIQDQTATFALRVQVVASAYATSLQQFQGLQKAGKVKIAPYSLPKNPGVVGSRVDGQLTPNKQGSMVLLPVRDKTLKLWTESDAGKADFDNIILPSTSFVP